MIRLACAADVVLDAYVSIVLARQQPQYQDAAPLTLRHTRWPRLLLRRGAISLV
jgi:hypothetical protein